MTNPKTWRGGMIGAGAWSDVQLTAWAGTTNARIVALTDRHPERRDPVIKKWEIAQAYDDFETMLDQAQLDFVDICTRPYSHARLAKLAADRGIPILCQKPFCQNLEEAQEVVAYCQARQTPLMVNENFRWQAWYRQVKALLDQGMIGQPFLARMHQRQRLTMPHFNYYQTYFKEMQQLLLYEVGTHLLDTSRFLFGEPQMVFARLHQISTEVIGEDVQALVLGYPQMSVLIDDSWASVPDPDRDRPKAEQRWQLRLLEIDGTRGTLCLRPDGTIEGFTDEGRQSWQSPADSIPRSHIAGQQHFIDCLENGLDFETSGADNIKTMALVYACYRSAQTGQVVAPADLLGHL